MNDNAVIVRLPAVPESLATATAFVEERAQALGMPAMQLPTLDLLLEEVVVNVYSHAYKDQGGTLEVEVYPQEQAGKISGVCLVVRDWGTPFNPLSATPPDTTQSVEDRPIGGLGLLLVEEMATSCRYRYVDGTNELTMCLDIQDETTP
jgi:serine/threonine-protein kinase RsbW